MGVDRESMSMTKAERYWKRWKNEVAADLESYGECPVIDAIGTLRAYVVAAYNAGYRAGKRDERKEHESPDYSPSDAEYQLRLDR